VVTEVDPEPDEPLAPLEVEESSEHDDRMTAPAAAADAPPASRSRLRRDQVDVMLNLRFE
jgi:hypothetical protein